MFALAIAHLSSGSSVKLKKNKKKGLTKVNPYGIINLSNEREVDIMEIKSRLVKNGTLETNSIDRLRKLAKERGLETTNPREQMKIEIAYAEGYMVGKAEKAGSYSEDNRKDIVIYNEGNREEIISITEEQSRLLEWLDCNGYISDWVHFEPFVNITKTVI